MGALVDRALESFGLTYTQFRVLETLLHAGPMNQAQLGDRLRRGESNMHFVASNLEKRGLVIRRINAKGARSTRVHLTPEGHRLAADVFPRHAKLIRALMSTLKAQEQGTLGRLCEKLAERDAVRFVREDHEG